MGSYCLKALKVGKGKGFHQLWKTQVELPPLSVECRWFKTKTLSHPKETLNQSFLPEAQIFLVQAVATHCCIFFSPKALDFSLKCSCSVVNQQAPARSSGQAGSTCLGGSGKLWHPLLLPGKAKHGSEVFCRLCDIILLSSKYKCSLRFVVPGRQHPAPARYGAKRRHEIFPPLECSELPLDN